MLYNPVEIIIKKREGKELSKEELVYFVENYLNNKITEYQMSSLLMAIFFKGMTFEETKNLTEIYINSGVRYSFEQVTADKHSTGGVGDKISIALAPIVASCGLAIPMISGRGLGHTGGTLDKLESIPGLKTNFSEKDFKEFISICGFSIISQSKEIVPADKRIYALRDVTGTVESIPLITASIMSKKISEGAKNLVIDLKVGTGAFIKDFEKANILAEYLIKVGTSLGQKVKVVFSNMNSPLGEYVGNSLEIIESIEYLKGKKIPDIHLLTKTLASNMLLLSNITNDLKEAENLVEKAIDSGIALQTFEKYIELHKGNPNVCSNYNLLPKAKYKIPIEANQNGFISQIDSQKIGYTLIKIGTGRKNLSSKLNYAAGASLPNKIGDEVIKGEPFGFIYCDDNKNKEEIIQEILEAYTISNKKVEKEELILETKTI